MKTGIVGNGAIGNLLALQLSLTGQDFCLLTRKRADLTLQITDLQGDVHSLTPDCYPITQPPALDCVILPLKAYQIAPALIQLSADLPAHCQVVLLHNGMGSVAQAKDLLPRHLIIAATTSYGAYKIDPGYCILTGRGETHAGVVNQNATQSAAQVEALLHKALPPCHWHAEVEQALWNKLAINAVINPLTAIHDVNNGALAQPQYQRTIEQICVEVAAVMTASGYPVTASQLGSRVDQVIANTARNYSSMHQDVKYNRPTEIDFINGYVVKRASDLDIDVPLNHQLLTQIPQIRRD